MNKIFLIVNDEDDQFMFKEVIESIDPALHCKTAINGKMVLDKLYGRNKNQLLYYYQQISGSNYTW